MTTAIKATPLPAKKSWTPAYSLLLLFLANLLNIADRSLLGVVVDPVKADLRLSDTQMSIVSGSAFVIFNLIAGVFIARWVDRGNRKLILTLGVVLWSAATATTGLSQGFYSLALSRLLVGVGEATAFPVALSMIADLYAPSRRPRAISVYQASSFIGLVLGTIIAGVLAAAQGWRVMFLACGGAGLLLSVVLIASLREPARSDASGPQEEAVDGGLLGAIRHLLKLRGFVLLSLAVGFAGMAVAVLPVWAPAFLLRSHGVSLAAVGALIGPAVGGGGIAGTLLSGVLASRLARKGGEARGLLIPIVAIPLSTPFYLVFLFAPSLTLAMTSAALMNFLLASVMAPCLAAAVGMTPPRMRALSSTLVQIAAGVIGGAIAPLVVGAASDALQAAYGSQSLRYGLAVMAPAPILAGLLLWLAFRRLGPGRGSASAGAAPRFG